MTWLVEGESSCGHFSFTPTRGRGPGEPGGFDQQPIEAWSMATACARAWTIDRDPAWRDAIVHAATWFTGQNDKATCMWDPATGASYDGLTPDGPNENEGAESAIALIGTSLEYHRVLDMASRKRSER